MAQANGAAAASPDQEIRRRRLLGVGIRADLVTEADLARDVAFARGPSGVDLASVVGIDNLCQDLAIGLTTLRGSDVFNVRFGFLGLTPLTAQTSPILAREGVRSAVAEFLASDPRVRRIVDLQLDNTMAAPSGADRRTLAVTIVFEAISGESVSASTGGLASGGDWGDVPSPGSPTTGPGGASA